MGHDNNGQENDGNPNSRKTKVLAAANVDLRHRNLPIITFDSSNNGPASMNVLVNEIIQDRSQQDNFMIFIHGYNNTPKYATESLQKLDSSIDSEQSGRIISLNFDWDGTESMFGFEQACANGLRCNQLII